MRIQPYTPVHTSCDDGPTAALTAPNVVPCVSSPMGVPLPGVPGSGLSASIFSAVKSSSSPSSSESTSPAVNSKVTGRPLGSGARGRSWVWYPSRINVQPPHRHLWNSRAAITKLRHMTAGLCIHFFQTAAHQARLHPWHPPTPCPPLPMPLGPLLARSMCKLHPEPPLPVCIPLRMRRLRHLLMSSP